MFSSLENLFPIFEPGLFPWGSNDQEPSFVYHAHDPVVVVTPPPSSHEPASSNSGSFKHSQVLTTPDFGSPEPNLSTSKNSSSGSDIDERKHKRMISNRESAKRSRMRKQKHLENLRSQVSRLKLANRQTMNRLSVAVQQNQLVLRENEYLLSESAMLRQRLWNIRQALIVRELQQNLNPSAWPCNNFTYINEGQLQHYSLIT